MPGPTAEPIFSLSSVWVTSSHTVGNLMGHSACHHLYENTACLSVKLSFSKTFFMNFHHGVKSLGDCPAHWTKLLATTADSKQGAWGTGVLRKLCCIESGHDSELSVHPLKDPTADLQELHNLSLLMYELKRWQNYSSFLWLPVWLECCCVPSCRTSLKNQGWTVYTKGQRIYHSLCFCYICAWQSDFSFRKHSTNLVWQIPGQGKCCIYIQRVCPEVLLLWQLPHWQSALSNKYLGSRQAAVLAHHFALGLTLALHMKSWVSPKPRENKEGRKKPYNVLMPKSIIFGIQGLFKSKLNCIPIWHILPPLIWLTWHRLHGML